MLYEQALMSIHILLTVAEVEQTSKVEVAPAYLKMICVKFPLMEILCLEV